MSFLHLPGMVELSGQKIYKKMLEEHNEHLSKFNTFVLYDTTQEKRLQIREELICSGSMKYILKTKKSEEKEFWLIEITIAKQTNVQNTVTK